MTIEKVKHDIIVVGVGYGVSILVLLLSPNRRGADQNVVFFVGLAILIPVAAAVDWLVFNWRPSRPSFDTVLAFVTQTGTRAPTWSRRSRYAIPYLLGYVAAWTFALLLRYMAPPDWGLTAFAVSLPLAFVGFAASNAWWALAARSISSNTRRADEVPKRPSNQTWP